MKLALAGDTMLGRGVAEALASSPPEALVAEDVVAVAGEADLFLLNLECCISQRGRRWPDPAKPFFFRAPPAAVDLLSYLGVDCVTLANNHALDFGTEALLDTFEHLRSGGIAWVGAGASEDEARAPARFVVSGERVAVVGVSDHPREYAATADRPGIAFARLGRSIPGWLGATLSELGAETVIVTPHWGPNMVAEPLERVRDAAAALLEAGAVLVAGHSAHVFHGVAPHVLYDLGDFLDDYAVDPMLRNDLGLLFLVSLEEGAAPRVEAVPLKLEYCHTRLADGDDAAWIGARLRHACAPLGTEVTAQGDRLVVEQSGCE